MERREVGSLGGEDSETVKAWGAPLPLRSNDPATPVPGRRAHGGRGECGEFPFKTTKQKKTGNKCADRASSWSDCRNPKIHLYHTGIGARYKREWAGRAGRHPEHW